MNEQERFRKLIEGICVLQEEKEKVYGVDWKRFGLVSSMFNVFRKFIRLRTMWNRGWKPSEDDTRLDTLIDLMNYVILCFVLHAQLAPGAFRNFLHSKKIYIDPALFSSDERGFKLFCRNVFGEAIDSSDQEILSLYQLVPEIIQIGEKTIEQWLLDLSHIAEKQTENGENPVFIRPRLEKFVEAWLSQLEYFARKVEPSFRNSLKEQGDPVVRLNRLYTMIRLCFIAAVRHGLDCPQEWEQFINQYSIKNNLPR